MTNTNVTGDTSHRTSEPAAERDAGLQSLIEKLVPGEIVREGANIPPLVSVPRNSALPLSYMQEQIWFVHQLAPDSFAYNMPAAYRLKGSLHVSALERSVNEIVRRHEVLRTTFSVNEGRPIQVIVPELRVTLPLVDLSELPEEEREERARTLAVHEVKKPFDLAQGPLLRTSLFRLNEQEHVLVLSMHHIVSDGWSIGIFLRELGVLYEAYSAGKSSPLPELPIQYGDFAVWQRQWLQGEVLSEHLAYWRKQLEGAPQVLELPADRPRPRNQTFRGARESTVLSRDLSDGLKKLSRRENVTLFMTLLAAFQTLIYRYTWEEDVVVGTPIAVRNRKEFEGLIGFFLNTLVLRTDLSGDPSFKELIGRVRRVTLGALAHRDLPFEILLKELRPTRDLSQTPLFQVFLNMGSYPFTRIDLRGLAIEHFTLDEVGSKFDVTLYVIDSRDGIHLSLVYNTDIFAQVRMRRMLEQYQHLLLQIVEGPDKNLSRLSLATPACRVILPNPREVLDDYWEGSIQSIFSRQARRSPENLAVVDPHEAWCYGELEVRSNQLANRLIGGGIQPGDVVAIYGSRRASLVWALLGVLKAGAAFLILDPAYPASRLADYLEAAQPRGWIQIGTAGGLSDLLERYLRTSRVCCRCELPAEGAADINGLLANCSTSEPKLRVGPDEIAYVAFTSGSMGKPKGILGRHGPLTHFFPWLNQTFHFSAMDRFSMLSGLSHDPLHRDIFTPFSIGASIHIPDVSDIAPCRLARWMQQAEISVCHLTPAMGRILAETTPGISLTSLRHAFFVGDVLAARDVSRLRRIAPNINIVNFYGSTETQRAVGYFLVPDCRGTEDEDLIVEPPAPAGLPLGRGIKDVQLLVLNVALELAGVNELGEIYVRSPHLARGYLGDEALTVERFVANPFNDVPGDQLYRTGDLGRYLPDGTVEFVGRKDRQVKIRGFRIELAEIETVLLEHPSLKEAVVVARDDGAGDKRLIAYLVPRERLTIAASELRRLISARLPQYMCPSAFVTLDALPLNPNGKLDLKALPEPEDAHPKLEPKYAAPRTRLEGAVAGIWQDVLHIDRIGLHDNFFDLGGNSLQMLQIQGKIRDSLAREISMIELFRCPTISSLAEFVSDGEADEQGHFSAIRERAKRQKSAFLQQQRIYERRRKQ